MTKKKDPKDLKPPRSLENINPEKFADFLVQFAEDPECNIAALGRRCGMSKQASHLIVKRLQTRYLPVLKEVEKVTTKTLLGKMDVALPLLLDKMGDEELINNSALREIAVSVGVLVEKRQLLLGEPTQIMTVEERRSMKELTPALIDEMKKRSLTVDVEFEDIPSDGPMPPEVISKTTRHKAKREDRGRV